MRKLAVGILVMMWVFTLYVCVNGEWVDENGQPVDSRITSPLGEIYNV